MDRRNFLATLAVLAARPLFASAIRGQAFVHPPYLQRARPDAISVMWSTLDYAKAEVEYSADGVVFQRVPARGRVFDSIETRLDARFVQYSADITGLAPNTEYSYRIRMNEEVAFTDSSLRFVTGGPGDFTFLVLGDSGEGSPEQRQLAQYMAMERPSLLLHVGDIAYYDGSFEGFTENYFDLYPLMSRVPFFPTPGNHEYLTAGAAPYLALHSLPDGTVPIEDRGRYYSFDWSNIHFVSLDSNMPLERAASGTGRMLEWLDNDLKRTRQFWRVVFFHHPPYAFGPNHTNLNSALVREHVVPVLERHGVQVVFSGHEHSYQRTVPIRNDLANPTRAGITYFTCGGGGGHLYPVFPNALLANGASEHHYLRAEVGGTRMKLSAIRLDGSEIETNLIAPPPVFSYDGFGALISITPSIEAGALVHILGRNLAPVETYAPLMRPSFENMGTLVTVNGTPIPLFYASGTEIYGHLPFSVGGSVTVGVKTANGFTDASAPIRTR